MFEVKVLKTLPACEQWEKAWEQLVELMEYPSPFVHPDWILTVFKENNDILSPYIILVTQQDKLVGILPLYRRKSGLVRELGYVGDQYHPDPLGLCCRYENRKICVDVIIDFLLQHKNWDVLRLKWFTREGALCWKRSKGVVAAESTEPFLVLPESFDIYLNSFKRKKRYNLNAAVRKFEKAGGRYGSAIAVEDMHEILKQLFLIHKQRSAERNIVSSFSGESIFSFHLALVRNMPERVWLRFLEVNGQIIAILYGFLFCNRFFYYQIAHDPSFRTQSPGTVLLYKVIEECCAEGIGEFNFLQGNEGYKWQWTRESRELYSITIYNGTLMGTVLRQHAWLYLSAKKRFKDLLGGGFSRS